MRISSSLHLLLILAAVLLGGPAAAGSPLRVYVSILPQKFFVERVGGPRVEVSVLVGPGQSPETFEPTPRQMAGLGDADLFWRIGVPFEEVWFDRLLQMNPRLSILDARDGIELREIEPVGGHHHDYDHHHHGEGSPDPHVWLSPPLVKVMIAGLRDRLIELAPAQREEFERNHDRFAAELDALDAEIEGLLGGLANRRFMVFHPSWGYFADTYGLQQVPIEGEGKEPGARTLALLIEQARREEVKVIFVQSQFAQAQARTLAKTIGARTVAIDPLAADYGDNLRRVARAVASGAE